MASVENKDIGSVELEELEVFEIDGALLRDLLEEQEGQENSDGNVACVAESVEGEVYDHNMMHREQEQEQKQQQQNCLEQYESHNIHGFEWQDMMEMMEPTTSLNDVIVNWFSDEIAGMVDFGYANGECYSQIYDGLVYTNEASYGRLWED